MAAGCQIVFNGRSPPYWRSRMLKKPTVTDCRLLQSGCGWGWESGDESGDGSGGESSGESGGESGGESHGESHGESSVNRAVNR